MAYLNQDDYYHLRELITNMQEEINELKKTIKIISQGEQTIAR